MKTDINDLYIWTKKLSIVEANVCHRILPFIMWDLTFLQQWLWRLLSSRMWGPTVLYIGFNVSEKAALPATNIHCGANYPQSQYCRHNVLLFYFILIVLMFMCQSIFIFQLSALMFKLISELTHCRTHSGILNWTVLQSCGSLSIFANVSSMADFWSSNVWRFRA